MERPAALNRWTVIRSGIVSLLVALLVSACGDTPGPLEVVPGVTGRVTNSATGASVSGAEVRIGDAATTTGADGRFALTDLAMGPVTLRCTAPGFEPFEASITVTSGSVTRDIGMAALVRTVTGRVTNAATDRPVAGAEVRVGDAATTTGADGRFELTDLTTGTATLRCTAAGFVDSEADITVTSGTVTRDLELARIEVFEFGDFALYVPATVDVTRGLLLALGGPDTRGFSTGKPMGAPVPEVEASLQALGQAFRELAATHGLAVLGTSRAAMTNGPDSDRLLLDAVQTAAGRSGRPDLLPAPMLLYGMSGGAPQASGFTARNSNRVAGLFLKVPTGVASVTNGNTLGVPTYMVLAELDAFVDNTALTAAFQANRRAGALWALAKEPAVPHHSLTVAQRQVTLDWISTILKLRLPVIPSGPLHEIEASGWLGDHATGETAPWAQYPGERALASWLPSQTTAERWKAFIADAEPGTYPDIAGVYDLTAPITGFDPVWGDLTGYRYTSVLIIQRNNRDRFEGTYADLQLIGPGGESSDWEYTGFVSGSIDLDGRVVIELVGGNNGWEWWGEGKLASGLIRGEWSCCGHIGGTFTAERRQAE